jgi:molecular chaperone GrpE
METETKMEVIDFLRNKKLLDEDKESFKIIHEQAGEVSLIDLLDEWSDIKVKNRDESHLRLVAEFDNYKKRVTKEKQDLINNTKVKMLTAILDIDSDISIAMKNVEDDGVKLIASKLDKFLKEQGIETIQTETYDSDLHDVISVVEVGEEKIIDVISKGYNLNGKPFRYPKVILGR